MTTQIQPGDLFLGNGEWATPDEYTDYGPGDFREVFERRSNGDDQLQQCACGGHLDPNATLQERSEVVLN